MTNIRETRRASSACKNRVRRGAANRLAARGRLRSASRVRLSSPRALSLFLVGVLVVMPLMPSRLLVPAMAQTVVCSTATMSDRIFQKCQLGVRSVEQELEDEAIDDVLTTHQLPRTERDTLLKYGRNEIRARIYAHLIELINKQSPTADEQTVLDNLAAAIKKERVNATIYALNSYQSWKSFPCSFIPPAPMTYDPGPACANHLANFFAGPIAPTVEEFQEMGAIRADAELSSSLATVEAGYVSGETARDISVYTEQAATAVGTVIGSKLSRTVLPKAVFDSIFPFAETEVFQPSLAATKVVKSSTTTFVRKVAANGGEEVAKEAAPKLLQRIGGQASDAIFAEASSFSGPIGIIIEAISTAVTRAVDVVNEDQLPDKLAAAKTDAQNAVIDLRQIVNDEQGSKELYGIFVATTLHEYIDDSPLPPPSAGDRQFTVRSASGGTTADAPAIQFLDWTGECHTARLSGRWFVEKDAQGNEKMTLTIKYLDWYGGTWMASRIGSQFLLTNQGAPDSSTMSDEIPYQGCNHEQLAARIKFQDMTLKVSPTLRISCPNIIITGGGEAHVLGTVAGSGDAPSDLVVTVNDQASATVGGVTVSNLYVDDQYQIQSLVQDTGVAPPASADFTLKVTNSLNQSVSAPFTVFVTAVPDANSESALVAAIPKDAQVGTSYSAMLHFTGTLNSCGVTSTFAVTNGALPPGLSLDSDPRLVVPNAVIEGTPTVGGDFYFTVSEIFSDGEVQSRDYAIFVRADFADLPDGMVSWWRGENDAKDFTSLHNGVTSGGGAGFGIGLAANGFKFSGANGYVALPGVGDTLEATNDFTYELWFQTKSKGVILGMQNGGGVPYGAQPQGTRSPIYVGSDGRLRARFFGFDGDNFAVSANRVDDGAYHHVALAYSHTPRVEEVYLDGVKIQDISAISLAVDPNAVFQLGTGYVSDSTLGMFGWFNLKGVIDEPTMYNRALTAAEIKSIYTAGGVGKISVKVISAPPAVRDGNDGAILLTVNGGMTPRQYSKDGGKTFQYTNSFHNLSPGAYPVVIKDADGRTVSRSVTVPNALPKLIVTTTHTNGPCSYSGGKITINASGTTGAAIYSITGGPLNVQDSNVFDGLGGGTYTPWVRDPTGVEATGDPVTLVDPPALGVSPGSVPDLAAGQPYAQTFTSYGGTGTRNMTAQIVPPWATAKTNSDGSITVSGTPPQAGNFQLFFKVGDASSCVGDIVIPFKVVDSCPAMTLGPVALPLGKVGQEYPAFAVTPANAPSPFGFTVTGLPQGMTATATGTEVSIGGTPTQSGVFNVQVTATSASSCIRTINYTLTVNLESEPTRPILISEVRTSGPAGPDDEFIELYNNTDAPIDLVGYSIVKKSFAGSCAFDPTFVANFQQPGNVIPARGHFLITGSAYSLGAYAPSNASLFTSLGNDDNIAVFFQAVTQSQFVPNRRMDAVGFGDNTGNVCDLLREGNTLPPFAGSNSQYSYVRKMTNGVPQDTGDNASDFVLVSTDGGSFDGVQSQLGAPGPEDLDAPLNRGSKIKVSLLDRTASSTAPPNRERDATANVCNGGGAPSNCTVGTLTLRRTFTNNTGSTVKRLRFRVVDLTTLNSPGYGAGGGQADVRLLNSSAITVGGKYIAQMTLEEPPAQGLGGGLNSAIVATLPGTSLNQGLAPGDSINVQFTLGVQQPGSFRFFVIVEALLNTDSASPGIVSPLKHGADKPSATNPATAKLPNGLGSDVVKMN